jgi:hypothetical protein
MAAANAAVIALVELRKTMIVLPRHPVARSDFSRCNGAEIAQFQAVYTVGAANGTARNPDHPRDSSISFILPAFIDCQSHCLFDSAVMSVHVELHNCLSIFLGYTGTRCRHFIGSLWL